MKQFWFVAEEMIKKKMVKAIRTDTWPPEAALVADVGMQADHVPVISFAARPSTPL